MNTPIADFVRRYAESGIFRLHMPGHKAFGPLGIEKLDITEIEGADVLYGAQGIILESEKNASRLFGTGRTFYSAEGSSLCIKAMLAMVLSGKNRTVLAARNVHKSFLYGAALLDAEVQWIYPQKGEHLCSCRVEPDALREKLSYMEHLPAAVYVTSPDYLGNIQDIRGLSSVCREAGVPLIVDNAHGAYLRFLEKDLHPIALGADMCCDSAHKTLPVLTGGAYLHVSENASSFFFENGERYLSLFASTSPSYLVLQSLDLCNGYLNDGYREKLAETVTKVEALKAALSGKGFALSGQEPIKLTLSGDGCAMAKALRDECCEPEFYDRDTMVLMFTPETDDTAYERVYKALSHAELCKKSEATLPEILPATRGVSIREATLGRQTSVPVAEAVGRICASPAVSCPPAVPIVMSGELICREAAEHLLYYGYESIDVLE